MQKISYTEYTMSPLSIGLIALAVIGAVLLMRPRRFYFVRHGETVLNQQHIRQGEAGELSENGGRQAEVVGAYLKRFSIERIISSTYPRAKETSEIINKHLNVPILYSPLLAERRNPKEIIGKSTNDSEVVRIVDQMDNAYHEDEYRFSDEENFIDLKKRARKCLNLLALQGVNETVVVTHHVFLKMLVAYLLYREQLHSADFVKLSFFNYSDNAGITVCEFSPLNIFSPTRGWRVTSYNEQPK
ncbi:MAG: histidine phosphatase family protein [bacterium]|nr:histidine phosphatase family protein [bacterium]